MRGSRTGIVLLLVSAVLAGCGSSGDDRQPGLTSAQARSLVAQLESARASAAARNVPGTEAAVDKFRRSVARLRRAGALSDATASSLRSGAARLLQRVKSDNAPPAQTTTTPATDTTPAPLPPGHKKKGEHGKGKGHKEKDD